MFFKVNKKIEKKRKKKISLNTEKKRKNDFLAATFLWEKTNKTVWIGMMNDGNIFANNL